MKFAKDKWLSTDGLLLKYDKLEHMIFFAAVCAVLTWWQGPHVGFWGATIIGIGNEIKDALLPYQKYGWFGGDGFSLKDLAANQTGIAILLILLSL